MIFRIFKYKEYYYDHISNSLKNIINNSIIYNVNPENIKLINNFKINALYNYFYKVNGLIDFMMNKEIYNNFRMDMNIIEICKYYDYMHDNYEIKNSISEFVEVNNIIKTNEYNKLLINNVVEYCKRIYNWIFDTNFWLHTVNFVVYHTKNVLCYYNPFTNKLMYRKHTDNLQIEYESTSEKVESRYKKYVIKNLQILINSKKTSQIKYTLDDNKIICDNIEIEIEAFVPYLKYKETKTLDSNKIKAIINNVYYDMLEKWVKNNNKLC